MTRVAGTPVNPRRGKDKPLVWQEGIANSQACKTIVSKLQASRCDLLEHHPFWSEFPQEVPRGWKQQSVTLCRNARFASDPTISRGAFAFDARVPWLKAGENAERWAILLSQIACLFAGQDRRKAPKSPECALRVRTGLGGARMWNCISWQSIFQTHLALLIPNAPKSCSPSGSLSSVKVSQSATCWVSLGNGIVCWFSGSTMPAVSTVFPGIPGSACRRGRSTGLPAGLWASTCGHSFVGYSPVMRIGEQNDRRANVRNSRIHARPSNLLVRARTGNANSLLRTHAELSSLSRGNSPRRIAAQIPAIGACHSISEAPIDRIADGAAILGRRHCWSARGSQKKS